jgi:ribose transport system substrate-binding protein
MKRIVGVLLVLFVIVAFGLALTGCAKEEAPAEETAAVPAEEPVAKMVFIVKSMDNPFWDSMIEGANQAAKDLNLEIESLAPIKPYNVEEQLRFMEDAITKGVDAIIVVPADGQGIIPGIEKANAAGIPVVTPNTRAAGGKVVSWDGAANFDAAYEVAKYVLDQLGASKKVIYLEGTPGNQTATDRTKGAHKAIEEAGAQLLASQTAKFSRVEGQNVMENLLQQFPQIDAVIAGNDEMALGAIEALDAAGRLEGVKVSGFDGNNDAKKALKEGRLTATGDQRPDAQAYWGVVSAFIELKGMPVARDIYLPAPIMTPENVDKFM